MLGPTGKGILAGEKGASVFTEPFLNHDFSPNQLPEVVKRIEATGDDRSLVIVSAALLERHLDVLSEFIAPGFGAMAKNREVTLSVKLNFLNALRMIPPHIVHTADLLRRVRNEFAHNADINRFDELSQGIKIALAQRIEELFGNQQPYSSSLRDTVKGLVVVVLLGFQSFAVNLKILREKLDDGSFIEDLKKECSQRFNAKLDAIKSRPRMKVEEKEGWRYRYYEQGVVEIDAVDPNNEPATPAVIPNEFA